MVAKPLESWSGAVEALQTAAMEFEGKWRRRLGFLREEEAAACRISVLVLFFLYFFLKDPYIFLFTLKSKMCNFICKMVPLFLLFLQN